MLFNDDQDKIYFNGLIFYKINNKWWRVLEKQETYNTNTRLISCIVPEIQEEIVGGIDEINKKFLRIEKLKSLLLDD